MITCPCCKHSFEPVAPAAALTTRQAELLEFVRGYIGTSGYAPSYVEMRNHMNLASKSGINRLICGLEKHGQLRRNPGKARAIELVGGLS